MEELTNASCSVRWMYFLITANDLLSSFFFVDIFKTTRPLGNFAAILLTYVASSVLHVRLHWPRLQY